MKRIFAYLLAAAALPLFNRFQQVDAYHNGTVLYSQHLYGQTIGITIALAVVVLVGGVLAFSGLRSKLHRRDVGAVIVGLLALPVLWQDFQGSSFGGGSDLVKITAGLGGPLSRDFFFAAAAAFIVVELFFRAREADLESMR